MVKTICLTINKDSNVPPKAIQNRIDILVIVKHEELCNVKIREVSKTIWKDGDRLRLSTSLKEMSDTWSEKNHTKFISDITTFLLIGLSNLNRLSSIFWSIKIEKNYIASGNFLWKSCRIPIGYLFAPKFKLFFVTFLLTKEQFFSKITLVKIFHTLKNNNSVGQLKKMQIMSLRLTTIKTGGMKPLQLHQKNNWKDCWSKRESCVRNR